MNSIIFLKIIDIHLNFNLCVLFYILHYQKFKVTIYRNPSFIIRNGFFSFFLKQKVKIADALLSDV